ncbi:hypothetical protein GCM10011495_37560 [Hymenobacter frigidus]|uniref:Uncharacterized protein n=1 Tax=Hymenobacter frigidus TaxID=1524095 RepID=A0ABQ2AG11_9BACT|nr:hypothetical protein GCM10011495_37560 [Hymenobacter frigidus]
MPLETKYYPGLGVVAAVGYEICQRKSLAIDLKTKIIYRNVAMQEGKTNGVAMAVLPGVSLLISPAPIPVLAALR